jgi:hypothetical protein
MKRQDEDSLRQDDDRLRKGLSPPPTLDPDDPPTVADRPPPEPTPPPTPDPDDPPTPVACLAAQYGSCSATQSLEDLPPDTIVSNYDRPPGTWWPDCDFCGPPPDCDFCGPPPDVCGPPVALRRSARIRDANRRRRRLRRSGPDEYWSSNFKACRMQYLLALPPAKGT